MIIIIQACECPKCGAHIKIGHHKCEYCGAEFVDVPWKTGNLSRSNESHESGCMTARSTNDGKVILTTPETGTIICYISEMEMTMDYEDIWYLGEGRCPLKKPRWTITLKQV